MDIQLKDLHPFVRYVHFFSVLPHDPGVPGIPYEPRLFYLENGHGKIEAARKEYEMFPGCLILINAGTEYRFLPTEEQAEYVGINFDFTLRSAHLEMPICLADSRETYRADLLGKDTFSDVPEWNEVMYLPQMNFLTDAVSGMVSDYYSRYCLFREQLSGTLFSILIRCLREVRTPRGSDRNRKAQEILEYIREHYPENITNASLGEIFHFHPNYVNRLIKERTGFSAHQYVLHVRISQAVKLLTEQDLSVAQIAEQCGFFDTCHFTKAFKRTVGVTPGEFKRKRV